jgi:hypothetical protein
MSVRNPVGKENFTRFKFDLMERERKSWVWGFVGMGRASPMRGSKLEFGRNGKVACQGLQSIPPWAHAYFRTF